MASIPSPYRDEESAVPEPSIAESDDLHFRSRASSEVGHPQDLPVWLRESSSRWRIVPLPLRKITRSIAKVCALANQWTQGQKVAQKQEIRPFLPLIQEAPLWLVEKCLPKRIYKFSALLLLYTAWAVTFILVIKRSAASGNIEGYGIPNSIWCGASFWNSGNECGLNGNNCRPFSGATFTFRCPGNCRSVEVLENYPIGNQEIIYENLVIGGGGANESTSRLIYRADSFICQAAIHAGIVSNTHGGCGVALLTGTQKGFPASASNGIQSISFDADFPKSYTFLTDLNSYCGVVDNRWALLGVTVSFTVLLSLFVNSPSIFFFSTFTMIFIHVGFVSDPPNIMNYSDLFSNIIGKFLPACFITYVFYRFCIHRTLQDLTAQFEKTILWLGACWIGALDNYTFSRMIPLQRLTPHDLAQPGAVLALTIIVITIALIAISQIYYLRLEHRLRTYISLYSIIITLLLIGVAIPTLNLRIHHYILAMIFLPGTSMQTRPSLVYQGLLIGLFINGVARWGFASILETSFALFGSGSGGSGDGGDQVSHLPNITALVFPALSSITFSWSLPVDGFDGLSVLRNDVETFRWYVGEGNASHTEYAREGFVGQDTFYRFAYMSGSSTGEYTKAGVWARNGSWIGIG